MGRSVGWARQALIWRWTPVIKRFRRWRHFVVETEIVNHHFREEVIEVEGLPSLHSLYAICCPGAKLDQEKKYWERDRELVEEVEQKIWPLGRRWGDAVG